MNEFKIFQDFIVDSFKELWANFKIHQNNFFSLLFLGFLSCIPWQNLGFEDNSLPEIVNTALIALMSIIVVVNIILIEKKIKLGRPKEKLLYAIPTYLIYNFYSSFLFLAPVMLVFALTKSLFFAVIPGIFSGVCLVMVPVSSLCIDNDEINYFKHSLKATRRTPIVIFLFFLMTILLETIPLSLDLVASSSLKLGLGLFYSFIEAVLLIVLTKVSVKIFYS